MKKTIATLAIIGTLALTGCTNTPSTESDPATNDSQYHWEQRIKLEDGRAVVCVTYKQGYGGGLSCDWDGAK